MKGSRFTKEQIASALRQAESGTPARQVYRRMAIREQTLYRWKKEFVGMGVAGAAGEGARGGDPQAQAARG